MSAESEERCSDDTGHRETATAIVAPADEQTGSRVTRIVGSGGLAHGCDPWPLVVTRDAYALPDGYWRPSWAKV